MAKKTKRDSSLEEHTPRIKTEEIPSIDVESLFGNCGCVNCRLGRTEENQNKSLSILRAKFPEGYIDKEIEGKLPEGHNEGCNCMNCRQARVEIKSDILDEYFRRFAGELELLGKELKGYKC